jgi:hypothetical protein
MTQLVIKVLSSNHTKQHDTAIKTDMKPGGTEKKVPNESTQL